MTDNYDQSAITQVPAEVSGNSEADIIKQNFRTTDELYNAVRKLDVDDFIKRFASHNEEAGYNIYTKALLDMQKPEPIRSIYDGQANPEQDPDTYGHFDDSLVGKALNAVFGDTSNESMGDNTLKSLVVSNIANSTASVANAFYDTANAFGANMGRYNTTSEEEQERQKTRQLIEDTAKRMTYGISPETKNAMVEIKVKQDKTKELEEELSKETDPKRQKELEAQINALRLNPEEVELANDPVFKEVNQLEESIELYNRLSSLSQADSDFWGLNQFKYNNAIENPGSLKDHIFKINKMLADTSGLLVESAVTGTAIGKGLSLARGLFSRGFNLGSKAIYAGENAAVLSGFKPFDPKTWSPATLAIRRGNKVIPAVLKGVKELGVSTAAVLPLSLEEAAENRVDTINNLLNNGLAPGLSTGEETLMLTAAFINDVGTAMIPQIPTLPRALRGSATEVAASRIYNNVKIKWPDIAADAFEKAFKSGTSLTKSVRAAIAAESMKVLAEAGKGGITKSGAKAIANFIGNLTQDSIALGLTTFVQQAIKDFASAGYLRSGDFIENWVDYLSGGDYRRNLQESFEAGLMAIPLAAPSASRRFKKDIDNLSKYSTDLKKQAYLNANLWSSDETVEYDKIQDILNKPRVDQATYSNNLTEISEAVSNNDIDSIVNKTGLSREFVSTVLETSTPQDAIVGFTDFLGVTDTKAKKLEEHQAELINQAKEKKDTDSILGKGVRTDSSYTVNNAKRLFKDITKLGSMSNNKAALGELIQTYQQVQNGTMDAKEINSVLQKYAHLPEVRVLDSMLRRTSNIAFKDANIVANLDKLANKYLKSPTRDNIRLKDSPMDLVFGVSAGKAEDFWQLAASGKLSVEDLLKRDKDDEAEEQYLESIKNQTNGAEITAKQELIKARRKAYKKLIKWNNDIKAISDNLSGILESAKKIAEDNGIKLNEQGTVIDKFFNPTGKKKGLFNHLTDIFKHYTNNDAGSLLQSLQQLSYFINSQSPEVKGTNYNGPLKDKITAEHELMKVVTKQFLETNGLIKDIEASAKVNNITGPIILAALDGIKGLYEGVNTTYDQFIADNSDLLTSFMTAATANSTNNAEERKETDAGSNNFVDDTEIDLGEQNEAQTQRQEQASTNQSEPEVQVTDKQGDTETLNDIVNSVDSVQEEQVRGEVPTEQVQSSPIEDANNPLNDSTTAAVNAAVTVNSSTQNFDDIISNSNTNARNQQRANGNSNVNNQRLYTEFSNHYLKEESTLLRPNRNNPKKREFPNTINNLISGLTKTRLRVNYVPVNEDTAKSNNDFYIFKRNPQTDGSSQLSVNWIGLSKLVPYSLIKTTADDIGKGEDINAVLPVGIDAIGYNDNNGSHIVNFRIHTQQFKIQSPQDYYNAKYYLLNFLQYIYPDISKSKFVNIGDIRPAVLNAVNAMHTDAKTALATDMQKLEDKGEIPTRNSLFKVNANSFGNELKDSFNNNASQIITNLTVDKIINDGSKFTGYLDLTRTVEKDDIDPNSIIRKTYLGPLVVFAEKNNMLGQSFAKVYEAYMKANGHTNSNVYSSELQVQVEARNELAAIPYLIAHNYFPTGQVSVEGTNTYSGVWEHPKKGNLNKWQSRFKKRFDPFMWIHTHEGAKLFKESLPSGVVVDDFATTVNNLTAFTYGQATQAYANSVQNTIQADQGVQPQVNTVTTPTANTVNNNTDDVQNAPIAEQSTVNNAQEQNLAKSTTDLANVTYALNQQNTPKVVTELTTNKPKEELKTYQDAVVDNVAIDQHNIQDPTPANEPSQTISDADIADDGTTIPSAEENTEMQTPESVSLGRVALDKLIMPLTLDATSEDCVNGLLNDTELGKTNKAVGTLQEFYNKSEDKDQIKDALIGGREGFIGIRQILSSGDGDAKTIVINNTVNIKNPERLLTTNDIVKVAYDIAGVDPDDRKIISKNKKLSYILFTNVDPADQDAKKKLIGNFSSKLRENGVNNVEEFTDSDVYNKTLGELKFRVTIKPSNELTQSFNNTLNLKKNSFLRNYLSTNDKLDDNKINSFFNNIENQLTTYIFTNLANEGSSVDIGTLMRYSGLPAEKSNAEHMSAILKKYGPELLSALKDGGLVGPISAFSRKLGKYLYSSLDKSTFPKDFKLNETELELLKMYLGSVGTKILTDSGLLIKADDIQNADNLYKVNISKKDANGVRYKSAIVNGKIQKVQIDPTALDKVKEFNKFDKKHVFTKYILGDAYAEKHVSYDGSYKVPKYTEHGMEIPRSMRNALNKYMQTGYAIDKSIVGYFTRDLNSPLYLEGDNKLTYNNKELTVRDFFTLWLSDYSTDEAFQDFAHKAMNECKILKRLNVFLNIKDPRNYFETTGFSVVAHNRSVIKELLGLNDSIDVWNSNKTKIQEEIDALTDETKGKYKNQYLLAHHKEMLSDDSGYSFAWFPINPGVNYRAFQNGIEINPVASKEFTRYLMYRSPNVLKSGFIKNDKINGGTAQHIIAYSILQNFDQKPEKKIAPRDFQKKAQELLKKIECPALKEIILDYQNNGSFTFTNGDLWADLLNHIENQKLELEHTIQIFNIVKTIAQFANDKGDIQYGKNTLFVINDKKITNYVLAETDGITNGAAIGLVTTLGLLDPTMTEVANELITEADWENLNRIGIFKKGSSIESVNQFYFNEDGSKKKNARDMYENLIDKFRLNGITTNSGKPLIHGYDCNNLLKLVFITKYGVFDKDFDNKYKEIYFEAKKGIIEKYPDITDEQLKEFNKYILRDEKVTLDDKTFRHIYEYIFKNVLERNDTKYPFMTFNYAAGVEAITKDLLMNRLIPVALEHLAESLKNSKDTERTLANFIENTLSYCTDNETLTADAAIADTLINTSNKGGSKFKAFKKKLKEANLYFTKTELDDINIKFNRQYVDSNGVSNDAAIKDAKEVLMLTLKGKRYIGIYNEFNKIRNNSVKNGVINITPDKVSAKLIDDLLHLMVPGFTAIMGQPLFDTMMNEFPQVKFINSTATAVFPIMIKTIEDIKRDALQKLFNHYGVTSYKHLPDEAKDAYTKFVNNFDKSYKSPLGGSFPIARKLVQQDLSRGGIGFGPASTAIYSSLSSIDEEVNGAAAMVDGVQSADSSVATYAKLEVGGIFLDIYDANHTNSLRTSEICRAQNAGFSLVTILSKSGILYATRDVFKTFTNMDNYKFSVTDAKTGKTVDFDLSGDFDKYLATGIAKATLGERIADRNYNNPPSNILRAYANTYEQSTINYNDIAKDENVINNVNVNIFKNTHSISELEGITAKIEVTDPNIQAAVNEYTDNPDSFSFVVPEFLDKKYQVFNAAVQYSVAVSNTEKNDDPDKIDFLEKVAFDAKKRLYKVLADNNITEDAANKLNDAINQYFKQPKGSSYKAIVERLGKYATTEAFLFGFEDKDTKKIIRFSDDPIIKEYLFNNEDSEEYQAFKIKPYDKWKHGDLFRMSPFPFLQKAIEIHEKAIDELLKNDVIVSQYNMGSDGEYVIDRGSNLYNPTDFASIKESLKTVNKPITFKEDGRLKFKAIADLKDSNKFNEALLKYLDNTFKLKQYSKADLDTVLSPKHWISKSVRDMVYDFFRANGSVQSVQNDYALLKALSQDQKNEQAILENALIHLLRSAYGYIDKGFEYQTRYALKTLDALQSVNGDITATKDTLMYYFSQVSDLTNKYIRYSLAQGTLVKEDIDSAGSETIDPQTVENVRSTLEISEDNVTSVFDGLGSAESVEMNGHNYRLCSDAHSQYLRGHVRDAAKAIRKFTMIQGTTDAISHGSANQARDREGRVTQRMIKIFKGIVPPSQAGLPYSMQELMAHEMDHLIWWSLDNADPLYQELRTIFYRFRNAYQNHPEAFMLNKGLTPNTAEYRAEYNAAVRRMEYILGIGENASEDPIREFATFALTNESMRSILSQVPGESTESNKPLTNFIRMIGDLFLKVINKIFGKVDNNKYKRTDNLLANVEAIRRVVMERMGSYREISRLNELASTVHHKFDAGDLQLKQVVNRFDPQNKINRFMATDFGSKLKSSKFLGELVSELNMDDTPQSLKRSVLKSMIDHVAKINKKRQQQIAVDTKYLNDSFKYKPTTIVSKAITEGLLRTDIQTLYDGTQASMDYIRNVIGNAEFRNSELERHKAILAMQSHNGTNLGAFFINSCNSLANFMVTGNYLYDFCNHSNTYQIARLWGHSGNQVIKDPNIINQYQGVLNTYTTLKAISLLPQETLDVLHESMEQEFLADNTNNGYTTLIKYHENALRKGFSEINDTEAVAQMHKGYLKDRFNPYYRVIKVYNENDYKDLLKKGFKEFTPPNALSNPDGIYKKYMYNTIASPNTYVSGAVASIDVKARGYTVFATDPSNKLVDYNSVKRIKANQYINNKQRERALFETITNYSYKNENPTLNTVFNGYGTIMDLQESLSNDIKDNVLDRSNDFADALARTSAAYTEIQESAKLNEALFRVLINDANTNLGNVKEEEIIRIGPNEDGLGLKAYANLPLVTKRFLFDNYISERGSLPIRKSVFNQVFGFKEKTLVTLTDKEEVFNKFDLPFKGLHSFINTLLGNKVGMYFGGYWRLLTSLGKDTVVIKNFLTTFDNIRSNMMLLLHNGVPLADILKSHIEGYKHIANYKYNLSQQANLINDLTFKDLIDPERAEIQRKLNMVTADLESNPMYNILRRGALTTIEGDESQQDYAILGKRVGKMLQDYHDTLINSNSSMAIFVRNLLMLHGSTLYQIANDFASGSDAIAKWIMYKNDPRSKGNAISKEEAFLDASELFVNYDLPTNEWIHWANQVGIMNFTKFMFRICRPLIKLFGEHPARVLTYLALKTTLGALGYRMFSFDAYNAAAWNPQKWVNKLGQGLQGGMVSSSIIEELPIVNVAHAITH